ncbi:hypothetical protein BTN49_0822 [Candidatus Enterovibrio escicola]|uniref:Uncharacterized protein n=1 Tax=Candidatus Enterovibrio escicola TaxID=1927127 RepID=A0A2A5T6R4_9GAMM|nr:hypothetical protein BTN49_0822 [Candidatus Enterovibrio escacola]
MSYGVISPTSELMAIPTIRSSWSSVEGDDGTGQSHDQQLEII